MTYRLKLYLDTSIDIKEETSTVFTSKMLKYEPSGGRKLALENYPMFTPYVAYPKERILNMKYYQRVELFFNKTKFKRIIMARWNGRKDVDKKQQKKREETNLDIFIKAIMPTAYPIVNNYNKSYEYFESTNLFDITTKGIGEGLPLPRRFRKEFSHLIVNNNTYTITGITLKNDIYNHPIYSKLINEYANIDSADLDINIQQDEEDFYEREFFKTYKTVTSSGKSSGGPLKDQTLWEIINNSANEFNDGQNGPMVKRFDDFVKSLVGRPVDDRYQKVQVFYKALGSLSHEGLNKRNDYDKEVTRLSFMNTTGNYLNILYENRDSIDLLPQINRELITSETVQRLRVILKEFGKLTIKKKAFDYMERKEFDFSGEGEVREKEIREYIEKINPSFRKFSDMLLSLQKTRFIQNEKMREVIQKRKTSIFKDILRCREDQTECKDLIEKEEILNVGLDRIKDEGSSNFTTVELYLMVNVIEGDMNTENYKKIKCNYLDKSLGSIFESFFYPAKTWDISTRKIFFSVKDELERIEKNKKDKKNKTKSKKKVPKKYNNKTKKR